MLMLLLVFRVFSYISGNSLEKQAIVIESKSDQSFSHNFVYDQNYVLNVTLMSSNATAVIMYAISQGSIITIGLEKKITQYNSISGSSVGVIQPVKNNISYILFYLSVNATYNCSRHSFETLNLIPRELSKQQPMPGGCNLVYNMMYYPLLTATIEQFLVKFSFQPANIGYSGQKEPACDVPSALNKRLQYNIYGDYLPTSYSNATCCNCVNVCKSQSTNTSAQKWNNLFLNQKLGVKLKSLQQTDKTDFTIAINPCLNMVIYVVVRDPLYNTQSEYVPSVVLREKLRSVEASSIYMQIYSIILFLLGFILCLAGHRLFPYEIFAFSSLFFFIIFYVVIERLSTVLTLNETTAIATGVSIVSGLLVVSSWWRYGHAIYYCFFISFVGGFLFSSAVFATPLVNLKYLQNILVYSPFFILCMAVYVAGFLCLPPHNACIVTSAFVGSYLCMLAISAGVFLCAGVSRVALLSLFRFSNNQFQSAIIFLPLSTNDIIIIVSWSLLFFLGCLVQCRFNKAQPGFPDSPRRRRQVQPSSIVSSVQVSTSDTDSTSSRGPSYTSENYEGDVSGSFNESVDLSNQFSTDATPLINATQIS